MIITWARVVGCGGDEKCSDLENILKISTSFPDGPDVGYERKKDINIKGDTEALVAINWNGEACRQSGVWRGCEEVNPDMSCLGCLVSSKPWKSFRLEIPNESYRYIGEI